MIEYADEIGIDYALVVIPLIYLDHYQEESTSIKRPFG